MIHMYLSGTLTEDLWLKKRAMLPMNVASMLVLKHDPDGKTSRTTCKTSFQFQKSRNPAPARHVFCHVHRSFWAGIWMLQNWLFLRCIHIQSSRMQSLQMHTHPIPKQNSREPMGNSVWPFRMSSSSIPALPAFVQSYTSVKEAWNVETAWAWGLWCCLGRQVTLHI